MLNPWPVVIRLVVALAVTVGAVIAINRYAARAPESPPDLRVTVFTAVFEDLEAERARLKRWREASGRIVFPGLADGECRAFRDAAMLDPPVNDRGFALRWPGPPPLEATLGYARLYNQTLRDLQRSRHGDCGVPPSSPQE